MSDLSSITKALGLGQVFGNGQAPVPPSSVHPIHPATVHFPIAFLSLSYMLDNFHAAYTRTPLSSLMTVSSATMSEMSRIAHYSNVLGIITAMPAAATGVAEMLAMWKANSLKEKIVRESDGKVVYDGYNPKLLTGIVHGMLNELALVISLVNWWTKRGAKDYAPSGLNEALSALTLPALLFSAFLGGKMVYEYGVGVQRQGEAKKIGEDMGRDELKRREGNTQIKERKGQ
ncbi:hypothetical protein B0A49_06097 [Cryomyces minteri]|uniref:DUF2231 domain-containing protein n=1 Tax=Cryomyces minteri TaxID=331657 RepID=A0A4U0X9F4_9PEZI|nr:hypothetical protein B0A49_06097 [Cryomyces minteri]